MFSSKYFVNHFFTLIKGSSRRAEVNRLKHWNKVGFFQAQPLSSKANNDEERLEPSKKLKYEFYGESQPSVILDVDEEMIRSPQERRPLNQNKLSAFNKARGKEGVFDIHDLVNVLRLEKMEEIAVIRVPAEREYCQYMVLANAKSVRHLNAIALFINKLYKQKKDESDPFLLIEGKDSNDWKVLDMDTIVLHLFLKHTRDKYDIESLWTLGPEYDDKLQRSKQEEYMDIFEKHLTFLQNQQPQEPEEGRTNAEK